MPVGSSAPRPIARPLTRRGVLLGTVVVLSGCSLRLQKDSSLPGPKASTPPDITPLQQVRAHLQQIVGAATGSTDHPSQAQSAATLHRHQLQHVDATLRGLGAPVPSPTSSVSTPASSGSRTSSGASSSTSPAGAKPSSPSKQSWTALETAWTSPTWLRTIASISGVSRPMVLSAVASGISWASQAGAQATWTSDAELPGHGAEKVLAAVNAAIDPLEWSVARTDPDKRGSTPDALNWLYAVRGMAQAAPPAPSSSTTPEPIRHYANPQAASKVAVTALQDLLSACATSAAGANTTSQVQGVMLAWSRTMQELARMGAAVTGDFPGMATGS